MNATNKQIRALRSEAYSGDDAEGEARNDAAGRFHHYQVQMGRQVTQEEV